MKFKAAKSTIRTIRKADADFMLKDGLYMIPRAGFEIGAGCPGEYRTVFIEALRNGWILPVAYVKERDYIWEKLCD